MMISIDDCLIVELNKIPSDKGNISVAESNINVPFDIKRIYYTYDIPSEAERGGHAHKEQHELVIAASGSFNVVIDDGKRKKTFFLNNPNKGLWLKPGIWRELNNFSSGGVVLVMNSGLYLESDYIRDYNKFKSK
ncbi:sugar 3,4-ketoisomerase [Carboxylicivirga linearis]|uniref:WxcM-like domain-containing protein n=1 Tax=Carboxylicivirga linearis TaxID=1628157 RepID=A0ABS5JTT3_9BACT|nr:FdtA/QdtA family cupin domain-containing protein [Carboxylicivirga linearis]MBS2098228.1 WxcM-like domain-containing protein [Carboxylicivirga linearis]